MSTTIYPVQSHKWGSIKKYSFCGVERMIQIKTSTSNLFTEAYYQTLCRHINYHSNFRELTVNKLSQHTLSHKLVHIQFKIHYSIMFGYFIEQETEKCEKKKKRITRFLEPKNGKRTYTNECCSFWEVYITTK